MKMEMPEIAKEEAGRIKKLSKWILIYDILCIGVLGFVTIFGLVLGMSDSSIRYSFNSFTNAVVTLWKGLMGLGFIFAFIFLLIGGNGLQFDKKWSQKATVIGIWLAFTLAFSSIALAFTWHIGEFGEAGSGEKETIVFITIIAAIITIPAIFILKKLRKLFPVEGRLKGPKGLLTKVVIPVAIIAVLVFIFHLVFYTQRHSIIVLYPKKIIQRASPETRFQIEIVRNENDIDTLKEALSALEKIGDVHAITTLIEIAWGGPPQWSSRSAKLFVIKVRLRSKDIDILKETLPALEMIADTSTIAALTEATQSGPGQLSKSAMPFLIKVRARSKDDKYILKEALSALEKIADIYSYKTFKGSKGFATTVFTKEKFLREIAAGGTAEIKLAWGKPSEAKKSAMSSLIRVGKPARDPLAFMLRFGNYNNRKWAAKVLKEIETQSDYF